MDVCVAVITTYLKICYRWLSVWAHPVYSRIMPARTKCTWYTCLCNTRLCSHGCVNGVLIGSKGYSVVPGFKTVGFRVETPKTPSQIILPVPSISRDWEAPQRAMSPYVQVRVSQSSCSQRISDTAWKKMIGFCQLINHCFPNTYRTPTCLDSLKCIQRIFNIWPLPAKNLFWLWR